MGKINKKRLKILHWNANGIVGKYIKIENLVREFDPDVISINETRTNNTTEAYIYQLSRLGYFPLIKSRVTDTNKNKLTSNRVTK